MRMLVAHARKRASLLRVVCYTVYYKFRRSFAQIINLCAHLLFYLQVEWFTNSLFGRRRIPEQTTSIVVLFDFCQPRLVHKPQTEKYQL